MEINKSKSGQQIETTAEPTRLYVPLYVRFNASVHAARFTCPLTLCTFKFVNIHFKEEQIHGWRCSTKNPEKHISVCLQQEKKPSDLNKPHSLIFCHFTPQPGNRPWQTQTLSFYKLHSSLSHFQISFPDNGVKNQRRECSELVPPAQVLQD